MSCSEQCSCRGSEEGPFLGLSHSELLLWAHDHADELVQQLWVAVGFRSADTASMIAAADAEIEKVKEDLTSQMRALNYQKWGSKGLEKFEERLAVFADWQGLGDPPESAESSSYDVRWSTHMPMAGSTLPLVITATKKRPTVVFSFKPLMSKHDVRVLDAPPVWSAETHSHVLAVVPVSSRADVGQAMAVVGGLRWLSGELQSIALLSESLFLLRDVDVLHSQEVGLIYLESAVCRRESEQREWETRGVRYLLAKS